MMGREGFRSTNARFLHSSQCDCPLIAHSKFAHFLPQKVRKHWDAKKQKQRVDEAPKIGTIKRLLYEHPKRAFPPTKCL
jgi:hypothetical protein